MAKKEKYLVSPNINNKSLITKLNGFDEKGNKIISKVINEKALTIFLNNQEIVTLMSISDHPKYLAVGYLLNQNMLKKNDIITKVEVDKDGYQSWDLQNWFANLDPDKNDEQHQKIIQDIKKRLNANTGIINPPKKKDNRRFLNPFNQ